MHYSSFLRMQWFVENFAARLNRQSVNVLDVGSYDVNGTYKDLFSDSRFQYSGLDMEPGPNVDIVLENPYDWKSIRSDSFDIVISGQAFEHIEFFWKTMEEMTRVLKKDGLLCLIAPNGFVEHRYPVDCYRFFSDGMVALSRWVGIEVLHAHTNKAPSTVDTKWFSSENADSMLIARKPFAGPPTYPNFKKYTCTPPDQEKLETGFVSETTAFPDSEGINKVSSQASHSPIGLNFDDKKRALQDKLNSFEFFHQYWEVEPGVFTPGRNDIRYLFESASIPKDLSGKRVLDIGAWNGCSAFECERRGAIEVVALDLQDPDASGFNFLKEHLKSQVAYVQESVYNLDPEQLGSFDVILFFGVLYHLRYPLLAADRIHRLCHPRSKVHIETHVIVRSQFFRGNEALNQSNDVIKMCEDTQTPIWRFYREFEPYAGDPSNWFGPNVQAVIEGFDSAGFCSQHLKSWGDRATFIASPDERNQERIYNTQEGLSPINREFIGLKKEIGKNPLFG